MRSLAGYGVPRESDTTEQVNNNSKMLKEFSSFLGDFFFDWSWVTAADPPAHLHAFPRAKSLILVNTQWLNSHYLPGIFLVLTKQWWTRPLQWSSKLGPGVTLSQQLRSICPWPIKRAHHPSTYWFWPTNSGVTSDSSSPNQFIESCEPSSKDLKYVHFSASHCLPPIRSSSCSQWSQGLNQAMSLLGVKFCFSSP